MEKPTLLQKLENWGPLTLIRGSIRRKLLVAFAVIAAVPLLVVGIVSYNVSSTALMGRAFDNLEAIRDTKTNTIQSYFDDRRTDMQVLQEVVSTMQQEAFSKLSTVRESRKIQIESFFNSRISDIELLSGNPTIIGALNAFVKANGIYNYAWKAADRSYGPWMSKYQKSLGYADLYLVTRSGQIVYSTGKKSDLGKNIRTGRLKNSSAGHAFKSGLRKVSISDFGAYAPAKFSQAAFVAAPITGGGSTAGVIMARISIDPVKKIMAAPTGLPTKTGIALVTQSNNKEGRAVGKELAGDASLGAVTRYFQIDVHEDLRRAFKGEIGADYKVSTTGIYELAAYTPLKIPGLNWVISVTASLEEILSPKAQGAQEDVFANFRKGYGYRNLYLISSDGYLFYSVENEKDYHTNLLTGDFKDTKFGHLVAEVKQSKKLRISDFERYTPSNSEPTAFIAIPMLSSEEVVLIAAAQMGADDLVSLMHDITGLGNSGDAYLIGQDKMWRTDTRFPAKLGVDTTMMDPLVKISTTPALQALGGTQGTDMVENYAGDDVLSSWAPVQIEGPSALNPQGIKWAMVSEIALSEVQGPARRMAVISFAVLGGSLLLVLLLSFQVSSGLTAQIDRIKQLFGNIGMGDFESRADVISKDELGTMAESLNAMLDNTLALIQSQDERDAIQASVMKLLREISALTEGDLTVRANVTEEITGAIADSFNEMASQLSQIVRNVKDATQEVDITSQSVTMATEQLADTSEEQAHQVSGAITAINQMTEAIRQVARDAIKSAQVSQKSTENAKSGAEAVQRTNKAMDAIRERVQETARSIKRLGESSQEIGNIVQIINDIADRTSILALNASIQAAMAGDAGRGFAVVAEEVQRLADQSTNSTKQIATLVKNIQTDINEAGTSMEESIQRVVEGTKLADGAFERLREIENVSNTLADMIQDISAAARNQAKASETISKTMKAVGKVSTRTSSQSRHTAESMQKLADTSENLRVSVAAFKIDADGIVEKAKDIQAEMNIENKVIDFTESATEDEPEIELTDVVATGEEKKTEQAKDIFETDYAASMV